MKNIAVTYSDIEIVYREDDNRWVFTLRGRERSAESLALAKAAIDRPEPKKKGGNFTPVEAWYDGSGYGASINGFRRVTITSIAEVFSRYGSGAEVWIKDKGGRSKVGADRVYPVGEPNDAVVEQLNDLAKASDTLEKRINATRGKLKAFVVPKTEDE